MNKQAFEISPLKAGIAAAGLGAAGGGAGYLVARNKARTALSRQAQEFNAYNQQENQVIAEDAFNQGAEYAVSATKQSSLKGVIMNEMEKEAKIAAVKSAVKDIFTNGISEALAAHKSIRGMKGTVPKEIIAKHKAEAMAALRPEVIKNLAALGITGAGVGGAAYLGLRKSSSLNKEAKVFGEVKSALKDIYASGFGKRKSALKAIADMEKDPKIAVKEYLKNSGVLRSGYKQDMAKNLAAAGLTLTGATGAAVAARDLYKNSEISKEARKNMIKEFIKKTYTSGFSDLASVNKDIKSGVFTGKGAKELKSDVRQEIARNLLAGLGTASAIGGAAVAAKKAMD